MLIFAAVHIYTFKKKYSLPFWYSIGICIHYPVNMEFCMYELGFLQIPDLSPGSLLPRLDKSSGISILPVLNPTPPRWHL